MAPPRWPFLVEIDAVSQLSIFFSSDKRTTVPLGMRIVGRNLERDSYFIAPLGLHLLYRRMMRRYDRAQLVLQRLRQSDVAPEQKQGTWPPYQGGIGSTGYFPGSVTITGAATAFPYQFQNVTASTPCQVCTCASCQPVPSSIPPTP